MQLSSIDLKLVVQCLNDKDAEELRSIPIFAHNVLAGTLPLNSKTLCAKIGIALLRLLHLYPLNSPTHPFMSFSFNVWTTPF